jgi:lipoate-protein ligase A
MAVDEALLDSVAEDRTPALRIYQWERPTLSLGYFQAYAQRQSHPASLGADVVRRLSGGGAILHDREITYSLVLPGEHPLAANTQLLYRTVHQSIVNWLTSFVTGPSGSWRLVLHEETAGRRSQREQPFLCFQRRCAGDVLLVGGECEQDYKIVGSAQRRRRGSVLQHGSILWETSPAAPELRGFTQLTGLKSRLEAAVKLLPATFLEMLQLERDPRPAPAKILAAAEKNRVNRYNVPTWNQRR